jgi:phage minor structural protein
MIPKLYESTETAFTSEGLGRLADATRCEVTEERNGIYELVLEYPVGGLKATELQVGRYIGATHDEDDQDIQPFEIYKVSAPIRGVVTVNAWHISYKLNSIAVLPFTADSCANALAAIGTNSLNTNPFTFWTDKAVTAPFELTVPKNARNILGGEAGSILDVYGKGEYEFDRYNVKLWTNRGADNGVEIRYGKNLTALDYQ